jgi:predicted nucleotidyltransferase
MKLHKYLEHLLGNKITISILRVLINNKGKIFTIRRLAEDAGASHPEVSATLTELEKFGIVQIQPVGRAHQISLNEKSYLLNEIIEPIFKAEKKTLDKVILILKEYLDTKKIITAAIFGSVVKGQEKIDSDIDLLVVSNDHDHTITQISEATEQVFSIFHGSISPIVFTQKEFKSKQKESLIRSIIDNHILICGKSIEDS